jgi:hypothetical protein
MSCGEGKLTALRADLFIAQIVSRNWLPKRCALGPMAPLNLRLAGGLLCQQERGDIDGVGRSALAEIVTNDPAR